MVQAEEWGLSAVVVQNTARRLRSRLSSREYLTRAGDVVKDKGAGHLAHQIDQDAEEYILEMLRAQGYDGDVFSEEAGTMRLGGSGHLFVTDPYCNTSLTFRGVRESAVTGFEFDEDGNLISAAVADLQCWRTLLYHRGLGAIVAWEDGGLEATQTGSAQELSAAFVIVSLLKPRRREYFSTRVARDCGILGVADGGIVSVRMCSGEVDGFLDHKYGQPAYESLPYRLVELAGGVVTDGEGRPVEWSAIVEELRKGVVRRQSLVAAGNQVLHQALMDGR